MKLARGFDFPFVPEGFYHHNHEICINMLCAEYRGQKCIQLHFVGPFCWKPYSLILKLAFLTVTSSSCFYSIQSWGYLTSHWSKGFGAKCVSSSCFRHLARDGCNIVGL